MQPESQRTAEKMGLNLTNRGAVSEIVDERTRFEMYYPPFLGAAKAGLGSIMCSCESPLPPKLSKRLCALTIAWLCRVRQ